MLTSKKHKNLFLLNFFSLLLLSPLTASAMEETKPDTSFIGLPIKSQVQSSEKKTRQAQTLSRWIVQTLEAQKIQVAIITREGPNMTRFVDKTGMTHSGYVFRHPETGRWTTYSLYADPERGYKKSRLWQQDLEGFYYGQSGSKTDALMLVPSQELQKKLFVRLTAQPFKTLLPEDEHYSLVAPLESRNSFNCTKWVLLQLFAAKENSDITAELIQILSTQYQEKVIKPLFFIRYVLQKKPDVNWQELSPKNHVHTVTVNSLLHSNLFEQKLYYHAR
jgi:hypothetical protein